MDEFCACGHHSHDHYSDPSGMAPSRCWHADTYDNLDYPKDGACNCRDYQPAVTGECPKGTPGCHDPIPHTFCEM